MSQWRLCSCSCWSYTSWRRKKQWMLSAHACQCSYLNQRSLSHFPEPGPAIFMCLVLCHSWQGHAHVNSARSLRTLSTPFIIYSGRNLGERAVQWNPNIIYQLPVIPTYLHVLTILKAFNEWWTKSPLKELPVQSWICLMHKLLYKSHIWGSSPVKKT